jgi:hypothetical protein
LKTFIWETFVLANEKTWNDFGDIVDHDYYVNQLKTYGLNHLLTPLNEIEVKSSLVLDVLVLILHLAWPPRHLGGCLGYI